LQTLLVAIAYWGLVAGFLHPDMRRRWLGEGIVGAIRRRRWEQAAGVDVACLSYVAGGASAILTQLPAGFFILGCNVCVGLLVLRDIHAGRRLLLNWSAAQLLLIGLWAIWFPAMLIQYQRHFGAGGINEVYQVDPGQLRAVVMGILSTPNVWRLASVAFAAYLTCFGLGLLRCWRASEEQTVAPAVALIPLLTCLAGYAFVHPAFGYVISTFAWLLVPYMGVVACGISGGRRTIPQLALGILLLAVNLIGLRNYYAIQYPRLDAPAAFIAASLRPGDGFVLSTNLAARWGIAYYWRQARVPVNDRYTTLIEDPLLRSPADARGYQRLWVLLADGGQPMISLDELGERRIQTVNRHFDDLRVLRFDRPDAEPGPEPARGQ
jgi:hypothetical protein